MIQAYPLDLRQQWWSGSGWCSPQRRRDEGEWLHFHPSPWGPLGSSSPGSPGETGHPFRSAWQRMSERAEIRESFHVKVLKVTGGCCGATQTFPIPAIFEEKEKWRLESKKIAKFSERCGSYLFSWRLFHVISNFIFQVAYDISLTWNTLRLARAGSSSSITYV